MVKQCQLPTNAKPWLQDGQFGCSWSRTMWVSQLVMRTLKAFASSVLEVERTAEGWRLKGKGPLGIAAIAAGAYLLLS